MDVLIKGFLLGFLIAAPVGPIGVICIQKTVRYGRLSGLFSGLGAATADLLYASMAALGVTLVSDLFLKEQFWLRLIGGAILVYLGCKTFFAGNYKKKEKDPQSNSLFSDFISTFLLTMTNPLTIVAFIALFASFGISTVVHEKASIAELLLAVFIGSCSWWFLLSEGVTFFKKKIGDRMICWINRIAGVAISLFGILSWVSLWIRFF